MTSQQTALFPEFRTVAGDSPSFAGVVFDFDGTLVDSMGMWDQIDIDFCAEHGLYLPPEKNEELAAQGFAGSARIFVDDLGLKMSYEECEQAFFDLAYDGYAHKIPCKPGAVDYIRLLRERGVKTSICSSLDARLIEACLENNGIGELFDTIATSDECEHGKDFPDVFFMAAERMGIAPETCLVFDDIPIALRTSKAIGMTTCGVYDGNKQQDFEALKAEGDFVIGGFEELLARIAE